MILSLNEWEEIQTSNKKNERIWKHIYTGLTQTVKPTSTIYFLEAAFLDNIAFVNFYLSNNGNINIKDKTKRNGIFFYLFNSFTLCSYE